MMFHFVINFQTLAKDNKGSPASVLFYLSPRVIHSSRSTRQDMSSSWSVQAPGQYSTRLLVRQSYLECLDRLYRLERRVHEEIQEVHTFMDLLDNYQSDATMEDSDGCDSTIDFQAGLDSLDAILPSESLHDPCFVLQPASHEASFGVMELLTESTESKLLYMQFFL
ncbi:uncharacterized protein F5147DRAFT_716808 [Suillus discolor]|uniref:Uncharacterized protein n=1 Tax=Suillus discolor TaxID=1912936 RepID=A0A9P7EXM3_9AGAM|nr:uncharacterized protein F5147DRAFT_716808 [Suillus discolor]KAG2096357.1 hypothetical protein F5147DRAFT_716808 [Suillus discolor]